MLKGLISGVLVGGVVAGAGLSVASLMTELPVRDTQSTSEAPVGIEGGAVQNSGGDPEKILVDAPSMSAPSVEGAPPSVDLTPGAAPLADTDAVDQPPAAIAQDGMSAPSVDADGGVSVATEEPVLPNPLAEAPSTPTSETDLEVQTAPAVIVFEEEAPAQDAVQDPAPVAEPEVQPEPAPETEPKPEPIVGPASKEEPEAQTQIEPSPEAVMPQEPVVAEMSAAPVLTAPEEDAPSNDEMAMVDLPIDVAPEMAMPKPPTELSGTAAVQMPAGSATVKVNRLNDEPSAATEPALIEYAAEFNNTNGLPLLSIILIDDGSMVNAAAALRGSPFPVSVALDPSGPDAAARMGEYRAAGIEVLAVAKLPTGATASDVEVALEASFDRLPEAIALIDAGEGNLQGVEATKQTMAALSAAGRGFVTVSKGLNSALREADASDVPASVIYRDLDAEDQSAQVIRRFLDQAAFRARQESGVVLLGRVRADTISALILWATANRAEQVAQAPVSAVLQAKIAQDN